jgi:hypothetical protein
MNKLTHINGVHIDISKISEVKNIERKKKKWFWELPDYEEVVVGHTFMTVVDGIHVWISQSDESKEDFERLRQQIIDMRNDIVDGMNEKGSLLKG